ncbi:MTH1187 family thiamine-binding protein [Pseudodesulfovibrio sp.]|uniref:MTH1187 family thiamine-binding protein n=1 Tax=unclassified Pseudodesulfovibrio TaxID=2661612 RepID=UPI003AFFA7B3
MSCIVTFTIFPLERDDQGTFAPYVAQALQIIKDSGLPYELGSMGTVMEGEYDEIMAVIKQCHDAMRQGSGRVYMTMAVDSREGDGGRMAQKVGSVEELLK